MTSALMEAISAVMSEMGHIAKDETGAGVSWTYRSHTAITNRLSPLLAKHKIAINQTNVELSFDEVTSQNGKTALRTTAKCSYEVIGPDGPDGEVICGSYGGQAIESRDKGIVIAQTVARREYVSSLFAIPTAAPDIEADNEPVTSNWWAALGYETAEEHDGDREQLLAAAQTAKAGDAALTKSVLQSMGLLDDTGRMKNRLARTLIWSSHKELADIAQLGAVADTADTA